MAWQHQKPNPHFYPPDHQDHTYQYPSPGRTTPVYQQNQPSISLMPRTKHNNPGPGARLPPQGQFRQQYSPEEQKPYHQNQHHSPPYEQKHNRQNQHHSPPYEQKPSRQNQHYPHSHELLPPLPHSTMQNKCFAGFWACFWTAVVLIGLLLLIIFLLSRPRSPKFDLLNVRLNSASLGPDALLHADITMQVNYSNPNRNVEMDFRSGVINLYYGRTFIASENVEPFVLPRAVYSVQVVPMVSTSAIQLPESEMQRLKMQINYNIVQFEIKGLFHVRARRGDLLRYNYHLHIDCTFKLTAPPNGVMTDKYCKVRG